MKLLVQPGSGVAPLLEAIAAAKRSIEIVIFRFDQRKIERALANAVDRGVSVHALIAHTNRAGEENLRKLELRMLAAGVTVSRTADDLARYHGKLMIVDRRELYLLAFNLTHADMERSRSFGIITNSRKLVHEAARLFEADSRRRPFDPEFAEFVVSPVNARRQLTEFISGTKKQLLIYDPKIGDPAMIRLLEDRAREGVEIKVIGCMAGRATGVAVHRLAGMRLHTRTMIRDGRTAFMGSQSLRTIELDGRREVGLIFREPNVVSHLIRTFQEDWASCERCEQEGEAGEAMPTADIARKVAKAVARDLPPLAPLLDGAVKEMRGEVDLDLEKVEEEVKGAVREAVQEVVRTVVEDIVDQDVERAK